MSNISAKVAQLRPQKLFAGVSDAVLSGANVRFATFGPGEVVSHHGDKDSPLVLVISGRVQATRSLENGREVAVSFIRPGESCGESAIVLGIPATFSTVAVTAVLVGLAPRAEARRLFSYVDISNALLLLMARRLEVAVDERAEMTEPSAHSRVCMAILAVLEGESSSEGEPLLELPSQATLALAANVSRETVSRTMKALIACGAVSKAGRRFHVIDRSPLREQSTAT